MSTLSVRGYEPPSRKPDAHQDDSTLSGDISLARAALSAYHHKNGDSQPPKALDGTSLHLEDDERELFRLLRHVVHDTGIEGTTLRVAGGWVRDKLLATSEFAKRSDNPGARLTSKFATRVPAPSMGRQGTKVIVEDETTHQPVDIDIALDDMLGREFADHLNEYLVQQGEKTVSVGVVLKNPEKSKHLETATMKVGSFWIDFVNLRAEEYTQDSRIPDLMRIGTPSEDAFRRDLTINALFYNINTGKIEDWTGRGLDDLKRGVVATPLAPLTTLLDDPLRVLRSIRFAARLRFGMDESLVQAAQDIRVRNALAQKVSRERVGGEVDLMLRSPDPVGAMRLLQNLHLIDTVFPVEKALGEDASSDAIFSKGLALLSTAHDHLSDCRFNPPIWCEAKRSRSLRVNGVSEQVLMEDEEARRLLWYAAFLKPFRDYSDRMEMAKLGRRAGKKANRSVVCNLLVDSLKRPLRDADSIQKISQAADDITNLINSGCDLSATSVLLSGIQVRSVGGEDGCGTLTCHMNSVKVNSETEDDPMWEHAMEFRLLTSQVIQRVGPLWRAALVLSLCEQLVSLNDDLNYFIEGDVVGESAEERTQGLIERYDAFAASLQQLGLIGIWGQKPLLDGGAMKKLLPAIPKGPGFREVMDEQNHWMTTHPGAGKEALATHLKAQFPEYV